ncbi:MAG: hypothetical protein FWC36_01615 [Spirochaetes bacterium]|nr:hypothetical protein [Spirochaetota bacterium]
MEKPSISTLLHIAIIGIALFLIFGDRLTLIWAVLSPLAALLTKKLSGNPKQGFWAVSISIIILGLFLIGLRETYL